MTKITPPADLPAGSVGFVATRKDRPERLAFYRAYGELNITYSFDQTLADVREVVAGTGYVVDADGVVLDNKRHTAIHEAGHAVIGRRLGMVCGYVTIKPEGDSAGHAISSDQYATWGAWEDQGRFRDLISVSRGRIIALMAGAEAEAECLGACAGGDGEDRNQIDLTFDSEFAHLGQAGVVLYEAGLRAQTRTLVRRHKAAIERVAAELLKRETLTGAEVDGLI